MADFYVWTEAELGLHIKEMDDEHIELIKKMNALYRSIDQKKPASDIEFHLTDLGNFTVKHFEAEERYMEKIKYDGIATHKIIHKQLLSRYSEFVEDFKKNKIVDPELLMFLKIWLTSHIRGIDMKYSKFVNQKS